MPIKFPKMHIAQSVLNRISNALEEEGPLGTGSKASAPVELLGEPIAPNPQALGVQLDTAIEQPLAPVGVEPGMETDANSNMLDASVMGQSPLTGLLSGS